MRSALNDCMMGSNLFYCPLERLQTKYSRLLSSQSKRCARPRYGVVRSGHKGRTLTNNDLNQVVDQWFLLKQWFAAVADSRRLRKTGSVHCYLRIFARKPQI